MKFALILFGYIAIASAQTAQFPCPEKLTYQVDWRLIDAGRATVALARDTPANGWRFDVNIMSTGLVSRLYRVMDKYRVTTSDRFCLANATLDAEEGKKHSISQLNMDHGRNRVLFENRDLVKNRTEQKSVDAVSCTFDILGAMASMRTLNLEPGHSTTVPVTDGKKFARAKVTAEAREKITVLGKSYEATRYQAYLFDNVLYRRRGRLLIWISNDAAHVPVEFRMMLGFPIGTVTVSLAKRE